MTPATLPLNWCSFVLIDSWSAAEAHIMLSGRHIDEFIAQHRLPGRFRDLIERHYLPLAAWLESQGQVDEPLFIGINGAQGTGKSTLADFVRLALEQGANWRVAVLSIDDFYLTKAERKNLAERIHPLMETRGVPGTHDIQMLATCIEQLKNSGPEKCLALPRFDKSRDERADPESWPLVSGPVDLIILEGWCVGCTHQSGDELLEPINLLEREEDASGDWRHYVNDQIKGSYAELFAALDALIFLQAPSFDAVYRWRLEQEKKLAAVSPGDAAGIMNSKQIARFIQHYERLTRVNLATLTDTADVVLELNENHDCVRSRYAT
jgi:D-glycerate 3-kinase